jgi:type I restriction enzyme S subunit
LKISRIGTAKEEFRGRRIKVKFPTGKAPIIKPDHHFDTSNIPDGWVWATIGAITQLNPPKPAQDELPPDGQVSFVPMTAVDAKTGTFEKPENRNFESVRKGYSFFCDKDVIFAKITPCMENGKAAIAQNLTNGMGFGSTEFHVLRSVGAVLPKYLFLFIRQESFRRLAEENMTGSVGQRRVPASFLENAKIPLPPLPEQKRIVSKVEEVLGRVNSVRERLARVQAILKRFRQSVLSAACSGRLTADWREKHADVEPACDLLGRIKEKCLESANTAKTLEQITNLYEETERKVAANNNEFNLPETWLPCEIKDIGKVCNGSTPSRKHPEYWGGGIPWISSGEVRNNIITETKENISKKGYKNSSVRMLPKGTVLLAMIGEGKTRGQTAITKIEATINQNIAAVIIDHGFIFSEYLWYWFQFQYEITRQVGGGTGPQALNCQMVRELSLNLPPFEEQNEIVRRVEALLKIGNSIERRVAETKARVNILFQAILAKAFRGELVPTEAELARREGRSYEPASSLLARIKAECDIASPPFSKKRGKRVSIKA